MSQYQPRRNKQLNFLDLIWHYKYYLAFYIILVSSVSFTLLYIAGGIPSEFRILDTALVDGIATATSTEESTDYPVRIIIAKIGINTLVSNPASADITVLNNELLKGAVRYPGSGTLGKGNMFVFGHSTGLKVVNNQAYKAFNNLRSLVIGDAIQIQSIDRQYNYKVTSVALVDSDTALVSFENRGDMLTLSTCNVFGEKQERFVVEAMFVKSIDLY